MTLPTFDLEQARHAVTHEFAMTLGDILLRRVPVALSGAWTENDTRIAAQQLGTAFGWSNTEIEKACEDFVVERNAFLLKPHALRPS